MNVYYYIYGLESKWAYLLTYVLQPDVLLCDLDSCSHKSLIGDIRDSSW